MPTPPRSHYYFKRICRRLATVVEPRSHVLEIGCGNGDLLASLKPACGVGIDLSQQLVNEARQRHREMRFVRMSGEQVHKLGDKFDYVVISQTLDEVYDLQELFRSIQSVCHARTRLVIVHYSRLWQPALRLMEWLRVKKPSPQRNWLPADEISHLLRLSGFETVRMFGLTIAPLPVPGLSGFLNRFVGNLPLVHLLGLNYVIVARPTFPESSTKLDAPSVSIVVPACNEAGHIRPLLQRIPRFAKQQEVIFVEGHSSDHTWQEIQDTVRDYDGPLVVKCLQQDGKGKGDAVRKGFAAASGNVLMILDADISVPPEELPTFYRALVSKQGEFINGSRMVYMMDDKAMRFLNLLGNKAFGWMFTYLLSQRFRDTLCGTKVLTRQNYERIAANRSYFGDFDPFGDFDLLFGAAKLNLKIVDVPVHYQARAYGDTNISRFSHGWMLLRMCLLAARKLKFV
ncbi:MAG: glycosyltransferase [Planctomycetes bacterium]|nr:glycosyltransferase [Planctomycetota bacterium]